MSSRKKITRKILGARLQIIHQKISNSGHLTAIGILFNEEKDDILIAKIEYG